jgi:ABC-type transport system involved in multi-copper enzyme maturation permease subunit
VIKMRTKAPQEFAQSTLRIFYNEFRREISSARVWIVLGIFVMFDLMMLLSFAYMLTADTAETNGIPEVFQNPTEETWANIAAMLSGAFYFSLLGLGGASYFGAGAIARDMKSGTLRLVQATPTSREATYIGRNIAAFFLSYFLAFIGYIVMLIGMLVVGGFADLDIVASAEIALELGLKMQVIIILSILVAITTTAAFGTIARNPTAAAIVGIAFFILIDSFLVIGASLFPEEWHLENLSFGYHQAEVIRWLIGSFDRDYVRYETTSFPSLSVAMLLAIPLTAMGIGVYYYRTMDLD